MKALVTGACGFIGSHLVDLLLEKNIEVLALDNYSTGRLSNLDHQKDNPLLRIIEHDLSLPSEKLADYTSSCNFIFHLAALADIVPSVENPEQYYASNVTGTLHLLQAARKARNLKKIMYAASSSCYGLATDFPTPETATIAPQYPYALTKYLGEQLLLHWGHVYNLPVLSLRLFNVYGPRSRTSGTYGAVFGTFLAQKLANKPYTIVGDGRQTRDFTYVADVAQAFYQGSQSNSKASVLNVGSGNTYSVNHLVELLSGGDFHQAQVSYIPKRPGEPDITHADTRNIRRELNWQPRVDFSAGVAKMLENIDYWRNAPVWTASSIAKATKPWFEALNR